MNFAEPVPSYGFEVFPGAVAPVSDEIVLGELVMVDLHDPVPRDLRDDRGRGHGEAPGIPPDDGLLRNGDIDAVNTVDEKVIRREGERRDGLLHGQQRRLENVHTVDDGRFHHPQADGKGVAGDGVVEPRTGPGCDLLGVTDVAVSVTPGQHHGGRDDGTGQRSPPCFIDTGNDREAAPVCPRLERIHVPGSEPDGLKNHLRKKPEPA